MLALKAAGASFGDRVRVKSGSAVFEGVLLPRHDYGDPDCLVLKLSSGYNVGVAFDSKTLVERVGGAAKAGKEALPRFPRNPLLPDVSLVATGGTISARVDYKTGGVDMFLSPEEILAVAPQVAEVINLRNLISPFRVASEDMTFREWKKIAAVVAKELSSGAAGVIVTHGTDTLHFTAAALSFMLRNLEQPVALVGAQRSPDRGSFDGTMNLVCGAHYAKSSLAEVAVVMHGTSSDDYCLAIRGTKARKMHTTRRDAFRPINDLPLARIWPDGRIEGVQGARARGSGVVELDDSFEPRTALVKVFPGASPEVIDFYVDRKYRGIVLEGTALGHAPVATLDSRDSWLPSIERAVEEGVVVAMATQCLYGSTNPFVYANGRRLARAGVVYCRDMLPETAFVKLGWLLGHKGLSLEGVAARMTENLCGEINARLTEAHFLA
ncbi:MAG: Glu-tRNA(Gln) amidotransferase subunit GatD [Candidatus Micrarchaeia archaeon]|jgi:glutamyl-tRNA(Gln) amidotransferase subunit D